MWVTLWVLFGVLVCAVFLPRPRVLRFGNVLRRIYQFYTRLSPRQSVGGAEEDPKAPGRTFSWRYCWSHLLVIVAIPLVAAWLHTSVWDPNGGQSRVPEFLGSYIYLQAGPFVAVIFLLMFLASCLGFYGWGLLGVYLWSSPAAVAVRMASYVFWFRRRPPLSHWDRLWVTVVCQSGITLIGFGLMQSDFYYFS